MCFKLDDAHIKAIYDISALILRSWPYPKDEELELIWFGSSFVDY